jgi:glutaconyl-CoA/methylmalonyl-CoA decarboxylase subunit gamma
VRFHVTLDGREHVVEIHARGDALRVLVDGKPHPADLAEVGTTGLYSLIVDGRSVSFAARFENGSAVLSFHDREVEVAIEDERTRLARQATGGSRRGRSTAEVRSVMPGVVKEVRVAAGDAVGAGQPLLILEAMKMENEIRAADAARVARVHVEAGAAVEKGALLVSLDPVPDGPSPGS